MTENTYDIAVTFGRFNLLHIGHIALFDRMADLAPRCLIGVSTGAHNLPLDARRSVIETILGVNTPTADHFGNPYEVCGGANPFAFFEFVTAKSVVLVLGEDQEALAKAAKRVLGWDYILVQRLCSSTEVRAMIDNEEWDRVVQVVPDRILPAVARLRGQEILQKGK